MNWFQRNATKLLGIKEALPYSVSGQTNLDDADNIGWTPLSVGGRELPLHRQDRMMEVSAYLYRRNPIAHRVVEVIKSFVVGEGIYLQATNPEINKVIQRFWHDRRNNWRKYLRDRVVSHSLYGEALWPAMVNQQNGSLWLGSAHPQIIEQVFPNRRNNFEPEIIKIKKGKDTNGETVEEQMIQAVKLDTDPDSKSFMKLHGEMFFNAINKPMDTLRGTSDLYSIADWLDIYDQFMFRRAERQAYMNTFLWDVTIEGASENDVKAKLAQFLLEEKKVRSGRLFVHNDKISRKAIAPDMRADDASTDAQGILQVIWGGTGLSSQAFGDPGGSGRQAGGDVNEWVFKTLSDRQYVWRDMILEVLDYAIDQAEMFNVIPSGLDRTIKVFMPKISVRDLQRLTQALGNFGKFASQAEKAITVLPLDESDKRRIKNVMHGLMDHIDQYSRIEMLADPVTGDDATEEGMSTITQFLETKVDAPDIKFSNDEYQVPDLETLLCDARKLEKQLDEQKELSLV